MSQVLALLDGPLDECVALAIARPGSLDANNYTDSEVFIRCQPKLSDLVV